jgi:hypothetical protein
MSPKKSKDISANEAGVELAVPGIQLPARLFMAGFEFFVDQYTAQGAWDSVSQTFKGVSGKAWLKLDCASPVLARGLMDVPSGYHRIQTSLEVVHNVIYPETEISLPDADRFQPGIQVGETLDLDLAVTASHLRELAHGAIGLLQRPGPRHLGDFLLSFEKVTIAPLSGSPSAGQIVKGAAALPAKQKIFVDKGGFRVHLEGLAIDPAGATATASLDLPATIASVESCDPASLPLGKVAIDANCNIYVERPDEDFGPWLIGDTGLVLEGHGYILDLSEVRSYANLPAVWMGLGLLTGTVSGETLNPSDSDTGYLAAQYRFVEATITPAGFQGHINLVKRHTFHPVNPQGYSIQIDAGFLELEYSLINAGKLGPGLVRLPVVSICDDQPGEVLQAEFTALSVQPGLDLWGQVSFQPAAYLAWGELTHPGKELVSWRLQAAMGYLYLPADPLASFSPQDGGGFITLSGPNDLAAKGVTGITAEPLPDLSVYSPDHPGGVTDPFEFQLAQNGKSWLRVGHKGVDGEMRIHSTPPDTLLGNPDRIGYVGFIPFNSFFDGMQDGILVGQYAASAVYDSQMDGGLDIPKPCNLERLRFRDLQLTSTAHLVGGDVFLPASGMDLEYWKLKLVPASADPAGVLSVRTGQMIFYAAGIEEPIHFWEPFWLTWGQVLANGNLGELFIDYNSFGQQFDRIPYTPQDLRLSTYQEDRTDGYLATCGTVHFNFFGTAFLNIQDARKDSTPDQPTNGRFVTVPKHGEPACPPTDLTLHGRVNDSAGRLLGRFDFRDVDMDYYTKVQDGFLGRGLAVLGMLHSDALETEIEIHANATDMHIEDSSRHDLDLGVYRVGTVGHVAGCIRFNGPLLTRIGLSASLEESSTSGFGILEPKAGFSVEVNLDIKPSSMDFYASGDIMFCVAASAVDMAAKVHLLHDYQRGSSEGEVNGLLNCNTLLGGLEGRGQVSWYVDPAMQYIQGRLKTTISGWSAGAGLEGGLFIGHNCPRDQAWVLLHTTSEHFGIEKEILPHSLTGLYGYGYASRGLSVSIFGGEVELFAGYGAFVSAPPGGIPAWPGGLGLPYVVGSAGIYVNGEILDGLVSASAWASLDLRGPLPVYFEGNFGLEGCAAWGTVCSSIEVTARLTSEGISLN